MSGILYLVSLPIGHSGDISQRAQEILSAVNIIACEDTRVMTRHLKAWGVGRVPQLVSFYEHNERKRVPELITRLQEGLSIACVSDAGSALISDPGYILMREAIRASILVQVIPGPTALITALLLSGLPPDKFIFLGFPPKKEGAQVKFFERFKEVGVTLIFYESPLRLVKTLTRIKPLFLNWDIAICREMTKIHEEVIRGSFLEVFSKINNRKILGEVTVVMSKANTLANPVSSD